MYIEPVKELFTIFQQQANLFVFVRRNILVFFSW